MADDSGGGGAGMGVILGALVATVAIIGVVMFAGGNFAGSKSVDVNVKAPGVSAPATPAVPSAPPAPSGAQP